MGMAGVERQGKEVMEMVVELEVLEGCGGVG